MTYKIVRVARGPFYLFPFDEEIQVQRISQKYYSISGVWMAIKYGWGGPTIKDGRDFKGWFRGIKLRL